MQQGRPHHLAVLLQRPRCLQCLRRPLLLRGPLLQMDLPPPLLAPRLRPSRQAQPRGPRLLRHGLALLHLLTLRRRRNPRRQARQLAQLGVRGPWSSLSCLRLRESLPRRLKKIRGLGDSVRETAGPALPTKSVRTRPSLKGSPWLLRSRLRPLSQKHQV